jgi:hypothetical protein
MGGSVSFTHAFNKYTRYSLFCSQVLWMCEMSAGIPCTPLIIPGAIEQTAAQLCFLVPVANHQYGCSQHIS